MWSPCLAETHGAHASLLRFGHTCVVVDSSEVWGTELAVVFGGVSTVPNEGPSPKAIPSAPGEQHAALSDTLVLQAEADTWFSPQTGDTGPSPRAFHCAAVLGRHVYVFGGHILHFDAKTNRKHRTFFNDLWYLDTDTWKWFQVEAQGPERPSRRDMASLTSVGAGRLLLFGGRAENGRVSGECWLFDSATRVWAQLKVAGALPSPRKMHATLYATNRLFMFGGERDAGVLDDMWTLKGLDGSEPYRWTQIRLRPAPTGRFGHAMAGAGSTLYIQGGCVDQSGMLAFTRSYSQCSELWALDLASFTWHRLDQQQPPATLHSATAQPPSQASTSSSSHPSERMCHTLVALSTRDGDVAGGVSLSGSAGSKLLLLLGGRRKDGLCHDAAWWVPQLPLPPTGTPAASAAAQDAANPAPAAAPAAPGAQHAANTTKTAPSSATPQPTSAPGLSMASSAASLFAAAAAPLLPYIGGHAAATAASASTTQPAGTGTQDAVAGHVSAAGNNQAPTTTSASGPTVPSPPPPPPVSEVPGQGQPAAVAPSLLQSLMLGRRGQPAAVPPPPPPTPPTPTTAPTTSAAPTAQPTSGLSADGVQTHGSASAAPAAGTASGSSAGTLGLQTQTLSQFIQYGFNHSAANEGAGAAGASAPGAAAAGTSADAGGGGGAETLSPMPSLSPSMSLLQGVPASRSPSPHRTTLTSPSPTPSSVRESITGRASSAFKGITSRVNNLLARMEGSPTPARGSAADSPQPGMAAATNSSSYVYGNGYGYGNQAGQAYGYGYSHSQPPLMGQHQQQQQFGYGQAQGTYPVGHPGPGYVWTHTGQGLRVQAGLPAQQQMERMASFDDGAALAAQAAAEHAEFERMRQRLGLPPTSSHSRVSAPTSSTSPQGGRASAGQASTLPSNLQQQGQHLDADIADVDHTLACFGKQLCIAGRAVLPSGSEPDEDAFLKEVARRHFAELPPSQLPLRHLALVLRDCQDLLRRDGLQAWQRLEQEHPATATTSARANRVSGGGAGMDLGVMLAFVAGGSHPVLGLRPEQLRMSDIASVHAEYRRLVQNQQTGLALGMST